MLGGNDFQNDRRASECDTGEGNRETPSLKETPEYDRKVPRAAAPEGYGASTKLRARRMPSGAIDTATGSVLGANTANRLLSLGPVAVRRYPSTLNSASKIYSPICKRRRRHSRGGRGAASLRAPLRGRQRPALLSPHAGQARLPVGRADLSRTFCAVRIGSRAPSAMGSACGA